MTYLEDYINNVKGKKGMERLDALKALRWYIKTSKEEDIKEAIKRLSNYEDLRVLIEAGMRKPLLDVVLERYNQLKLKEAGVK